MFSQENTFEDVIYKLSAIIFRPQSVNNGTNRPDCHIRRVATLRIKRIDSESESTYFRRAYTWDWFKQSPRGDGSNDEREQCIFRASQFLKLVSIPLFLLFILGGLVLNKGILLYVTSQIKEEHRVICNVYNVTSQNTSKLDFLCVAVTNTFRNPEDLYCIKKGDEEPLSGPTMAQVMYGSMATLSMLYF